MSDALLCALLIQGCSPYKPRHQNQWNSREQIWLSETSQLKVRAAQTRAFDTTDRRRMFEAIISTTQDLGFNVEVLDEELGIVSGKKFIEIEQPYSTDPSYLLYRPDTLLLLTRNFNTWGPFQHRSNLVRFIATIRNRGESQLVARTSAQLYLPAYRRSLSAVSLHRIAWSSRRSQASAHHLRFLYSDKLTCFDQVLSGTELFFKQ